MTAAYTPGPWEYDGNGRVDAVAFRKMTTITDDDGTVRPYVQGLVALPYTCGDGTHLPNALLIAAAPELLEALTLVRMSSGWQYLSAESRAVIDAAIAKAVQS